MNLLHDDIQWVATLIEQLRSLTHESHDLLHTSWPDIDDWTPVGMDNFVDDLIGAILCAGGDPDVKWKLVDAILCGDSDPNGE